MIYKYTDDGSGCVTEWCVGYLCGLESGIAQWLQHFGGSWERKSVEKHECRVSVRSLIRTYTNTHMLVVVVRRNMSGPRVPVWTWPVRISVIQAGWRTIDMWNLWNVMRVYPDSPPNLRLSDFGFSDFWYTGLNVFGEVTSPLFYTSLQTLIRSRFRVEPKPGSPTEYQTVRLWVLYIPLWERVPE